MTEWQPISTAPKDGSTIILHCQTRFRDGTEARSLHIGSWDGKEFSHDVMSDGRFVAIFPTATHWLPMPQFPPLPDEDDGEKLIEVVDRESWYARGRQDYLIRLASRGIEK